VAEVSETVCRTHCEAFADDWMETIELYINPNIAGTIRGHLIDVCSRSCNAEFPYGQKQILPGAQPITTNFLNFDSVLKHFYPTIGLSLAALITHPPVQVSDAECSCNRLGELLKDLGLNWTSDNGTIAVQLEAIWGINYPHTTIGNWKALCNPPGTDLSIDNLLNKGFPESLLCQFPPNSALNGGYDSIQVLIDSCNAKAEAEALLAGEVTFNRLLSLAMKRFSTAYLNTSVNNARESFTCTYTRKEYHYTLYYYDQAGNLIKTVPPAGVNRLTGTAVDDCQDYRADTSLGFVHAAHALVTNYKYNSLNQVREQSTPDGGVTRFWYDALGRLIVSQNAKQEPNSQYSYTIYDLLGRIIEVGQLVATIDPDDFMKYDEYRNWLSATTNHEQITHTVYDVAINTTLIQTQDVDQENLRNRISCVLYQQTRVQLSSGTFFDPDISEYDYASYYSYDVHGNVKTVVHDDQLFRTMFGVVEITKKIDYLYDLVSGSAKRM
jgi:YD repeat-containing protein